MSYRSKFDQAVTFIKDLKQYASEAGVQIPPIEDIENLVKDLSSSESIRDELVTNIDEICTILKEATKDGLMITTRAELLALLGIQLSEISRILPLCVEHNIATLEIVKYFDDLYKLTKEDSKLSGQEIFRLITLSSYSLRGKYHAKQSVSKSTNSK